MGRPNTMTLKDGRMGARLKRDGEGGYTWANRFNWKITRQTGALHGRKGMVWVGGQVLPDERLVELLVEDSLEEIRVHVMDLDARQPDPRQLRLGAAPMPTPPARPDTPLSGAPLPLGSTGRDMLAEGMAARRQKITHPRLKYHQEQGWRIWGMLELPAGELVESVTWKANRHHGCGPIMREPTEELLAERLDRAERDRLVRLAEEEEEEPADGAGVEWAYNRNNVPGTHEVHAAADRIDATWRDYVATGKTPEQLDALEAAAIDLGRSILDAEAEQAAPEEPPLDHMVAQAMADLQAAVEDTDRPMEEIALATRAVHLAMDLEERQAPAVVPRPMAKACPPPEPKVAHRGKVAAPWRGPDAIAWPVHFVRAQLPEVVLAQDTHHSAPEGPSAPEDPTQWDHLQAALQAARRAALWTPAHQYTLDTLVGEVGRLLALAGVDPPSFAGYGLGQLVHPDAARWYATNLERWVAEQHQAEPAPTPATVGEAVQVYLLDEREELHAPRWAGLTVRVEESVDTICRDYDLGVEEQHLEAARRRVVGAYAVQLRRLVQAGFTGAEVVVDTDTDRTTAARVLVDWPLADVARRVEEEVDHLRFQAWEDLWEQDLVDLADLEQAAARGDL